ncbi:MAG TPA: F0F1 ATP synthase subunit gamma [Anaerolineaceae bacterium]|nr:F0F1 ATP synthase subunit gamma [Anaerolineaceae bacterium]
MSSLDRAEARLENLEAIEPLLGSLRVLSLSTMQMALNRQQSLKEYKARFLEIARFLRAKEKPPKEKKVTKTALEEDFWDDADDAWDDDPENDHDLKEGPKRNKRILAVIGSSRGICGQYNKQLAHQTARLLEKEAAKAGEIEVLAFGPRLQNAMRLEEVDFKPGPVLAQGSLPDYERVSKLMRSWEARVNAGKLESVSLLSFKRLGMRSVYKPKLSRLLPDTGDLLGDLEAQGELFPEPIIEGDPLEILGRIENHLNAIRLYDLILDAIAAENLYRYRLLEEAKENTESLVDELSVALQMERRKAITQQMQQLGVASGMLAER